MTVYIDWIEWARAFREELCTTLGISRVQADTLAVRWAAIGIEHRWSQQTTRSVALDFYNGGLDPSILRMAMP